MARVVGDGAGGMREIEPSVNGETIYSRAEAALAANAAFLALGTPTNAQNAAQLKAVTRQVNALIRLTLGQLGTTSDT